MSVDDIVVSTEANSVQVQASGITDANLANGVNVSLLVYNESGSVVHSENASTTTSSQSFTVDMSSWADGGYSVVITVVDKARNARTRNRTFFKFTKSMSELNPLLVSGTTDLSSVDDWSSISGLTFKTNFGQIVFNKPVDLTSDETQDALMRLGELFRMNGTAVSLDTAADALAALNKSATITFYDYEDYNITTPMIYMNGGVAATTVVTEIDTSHSDLGGDPGKADVQFTVAHWTNYSIDQSNWPHVLYAYMDGSDVVVRFNETVELMSSAEAQEVFDINGVGIFSQAVTASGNEARFTLSSGQSVSSIRVKEGQSKLVRAGEAVPAISGDYEPVAQKLLTITNGGTFSVPSCANSSKILSELGDVNGAFFAYRNGKWTQVTEFRPLEGYKYVGDDSFDMPIYFTDDCELSEIKLPVYNDWNLLGLNSQAPKYAGDWLWSLTRRSTTEVYVNSIYTSAGTLYATYDTTDGTFKYDAGIQRNVNPYEAYWVPYAGDSEHMFFGYTA